MSLTATARSIAGTLRQEIVIDGSHRLITDEPERVGGEGSAPSPHELFPAALAACVATTLVRYARTKEWDLGDVTVDVDYDHRSTPPGLRGRHPADRRAQRCTARAPREGCRRLPTPPLDRERDRVRRAARAATRACAAVRPGAGRRPVVSRRRIVVLGGVGADHRLRNETPSKGQP